MNHNQIPKKQFHRFRFRPLRRSDAALIRNGKAEEGAGRGGAEGGPGRALRRQLGRDLSQERAKQIQEAVDKVVKSSQMKILNWIIK